MTDGKSNDGMKRAYRRSARVAEQVFRTRELMPSGPVAESESRVQRTFSPFSGAKDTESRSSWVRLGTESEGLGSQYFEANTELRHLAFSLAELAVVSFEVMEGKVGELTPEMDLTR